MTLIFTARYERDEHRPYNTPEGRFCEAGDDCDICREENEEEELEDD